MFTVGMAQAMLLPIELPDFASLSDSHKPATDMRYFRVPLHAACLLLLAVTASTAQGQATPSSLATGITWVSSLTSPKTSCTCSRQGVLKLTFDKSQRKRAEIVLWFEAARDFTFHIGDSSSNNGYAGDGATQSNDAELHNRGGRLLLYGKDKARAVTYGKLLDRDDFLNGAYKLTINVSNELVTVNNGRETIYYNSFKIFALDGQSDFEGPVNYDLYFGMNRVAAGSYRSGTGLCKAEITWHSDV